MIHRSVGSFFFFFFLTGSVVGQSIRVQVHGDLVPCVDHVHKTLLALVRVKLLKSRKSMESGTT